LAPLACPAVPVVAPVEAAAPPPEPELPFAPLACPAVLAVPQLEVVASSLAILAWFPRPYPGSQLLPTPLSLSFLDGSQAFPGTSHPEVPLVFALAGLACPAPLGWPAGFAGAAGCVAGFAGAAGCAAAA